MGFTGVTFFFVLSGFVLMWSMRPGTTPRQFYRRRFARVYPNHFVTLLVALAVVLTIGPPSLTPTIFVANLFLVQAWFADQAVVFGMNGVSWSLSCEAVFYACFPLLVRLLRPMPPALRWAIPITWLSAVALGSIVSSRLRVLVFAFPLARMGEFVVGMVIALAIRDGWRPRWRVWHGLVAAVVAQVVLAWLEPPRGVIDAVMVAPFAILVAAAAMGDLRGRTRVLGHRAFVYAGELSFAFYLTHELVIRDAVSRDIGGALGALLILGVATAATTGLHHFVERPAQRFLTRPRHVRAVTVR